MLHITAASFLDSAITTVSIFGLGIVINGLVQSVISAWKFAGRPATVTPITTPVEATVTIATPVEAIVTIAPVATPVEATATITTPVEAITTPVEAITTPVATIAPVATPVAKTPKTSINELRKQCTAQNIEWRNVRGNNKHLGKAAMLLALAS